MNKPSSIIGLLLCVPLVACSSGSTNEYGRAKMSTRDNVEWIANRLVILSEHEITPLKEQLDRMEAVINEKVNEDEESPPPEADTSTWKTIPPPTTDDAWREAYLKSTMICSDCDEWITAHPETETEGHFDGWQTKWIMRKEMPSGAITTVPCPLTWAPQCEQTAEAVPFDDSTPLTILEQP